MGKFVEFDDVAERFEGDIPSERLEWVEKTIADVEFALMGLVPSLRKSVDDINTQSTAYGDPDRIERVRALVCRKVLDMFRNPEGVSQFAKTVDDVSWSQTFRYGPSAGSALFTDAEIASVTLKKRRNRVGTVFVPAWA